MVFSLGSAYGMKLGINNRIVLGFFILPNNLVFMEFEDGHNLTLHCDLKSNFLVYLYFYGIYNLIVKYTIVVLVETIDELKLVSNKEYVLGSLLTTNDYELFILV